MEAPEPSLWHPLGELLVEKGLISDHQLGQALEEHSSTGKRLDEVLVARGFVSAADLKATLLEQVGGTPKEAGFGSGLAAAIQRRHAERPPRAEGGAPGGAARHRSMRAAAGGSTVATLVALDASYDRLLVDVEQAEAPLAPGPEPEPAPAAETEARGVVFFVPSPSGYSLRMEDDPAPPIGSEVGLDGKRYLISKLGRSPLPLDRRRCAYLLELPRDTTEAVGSG